MRKVWLLLALGVGAYLLLALVTLPASLVLARLAPAGLIAAGVTGTIWKGQAQVLQVAGVQLGAAQWHVHGLALLTARLRADVKLTRPDGFLQTVMTLSPSSGIELTQLSAALPISALPPNLAPGGWSGTVNAKLERLSIANRWPTVVDGTIQARDLTGPARNPVSIGSYQVVFPAEGTQATAKGLKGTLSDLGGPLDIRGTVQLAADRSYVVEGLIAARPEASVKVAKSLQFLGPADAQGRRPFSFSGTL